MLDPVHNLTRIAPDFSPSYWYTGYCRYSGQLLKLPRTPEVEELARNLMVKLARDDRYTHRHAAPTPIEAAGGCIAPTRSGGRVRDLHLGDAIPGDTPP